MHNFRAREQYQRIPRVSSANAVPLEGLVALIVQCTIPCQQGKFSLITMPSHCTAAKPSKMIRPSVGDCCRLSKWQAHSRCQQRDRTKRLSQTIRPIKSPTGVSTATEIIGQFDAGFFQEPKTFEHRIRSSFGFDKIFSVSY
jgi:hypothetical protein